MLLIDNLLKLKIYPIIVGTKSGDIENVKVSNDEAMKYTDELGTTYLSVSAKIAMNIEVFETMVKKIFMKENNSNEIEILEN